MERTLSCRIDHLHETHAVVDYELLPICVFYRRIVCLELVSVGSTYGHVTMGFTSVGWWQPRGGMGLESVLQPWGARGRLTDETIQGKLTKRNEIHSTGEW